MFRLLNRASPSSSVALTPKFYPDSYNEPHQTDMAVILVYFNASRSVRIAQNILLVKQYLDNANIPCYIGEVSIDNSPFLFKECSNVFHYKTDDYMFYKENLINLVESQIPSSYTKLCTMDGDVFFEDPNWYSALSIILDDADICQPFHTAKWLNLENNTIIKTQPTCVIGTNGHPGFAWAFKRTWLSKHKIPDFAIIGSGDTTFNECVIANKPSSVNYLTDEQKIYTGTLTSVPIVKYLNTTIYHLYHGSLADRRYVSRHAMLTKLLLSYQFKSITDVIEYNDVGLRCWKEPFKQPMNEFIKTYLINRNDDGI